MCDKLFVVRWQQILRKYVSEDIDCILLKRHDHLSLHAQMHAHLSLQKLPQSLDQDKSLQSCEFDNQEVCTDEYRVWHEDSRYVFVDDPILENSVRWRQDYIIFSRFRQHESNKKK